MVKTSRCGWCGEDPLYVAYHDSEWGVPTFSPHALFERLALESMQAGLSWYTVLKKREHMRARFFQFDAETLHRQGPRALPSWLADAGVIRHRGKLQALIDNAGARLALGDDFVPLLWSFVGGKPLQNQWRQLAEVPAQTAASVAMAKALRHAGFRFVGPTTCYAFMQSAGLVNDHLVECDRHEPCRNLASVCSE